ncbi:hypothetical protein DFH08DRAFT_966150 [Mycena albidolilacea]|uniref:Uncharacterized protein n=1 Tax=Mycena albidolilacea TaxID=1033008 RepID=A0AAD6ZPT5_9AGAR|nr:hypothetical protein DFH08DRAFT_966150 [Mycena albidolilacea]
MLPVELEREIFELAAFLHLNIEYRALKVCFVVVFVAAACLGRSAYYRLWASPGWDYEITPRPTGPSLLFPASLDPSADDPSWHAHNARATAALFRCLERADCTPNQTKVVILQAWHFRAVLDGYQSREVIWVQSTLIVLRRLDYTYLYADAGLDPMVRLYRVFAPLVRAVVVDAPDAHACFRDPYCALRREWAWAIPIWKILSIQYWDDADHPLGRKWTLSAEPGATSPVRTPAAAPDDSAYLGDSVQPSCTQQLFIPPAQRSPSLPPTGNSRRKQIYIYAKTADDFSPEKGAFPPHVFARLSAALGVDSIVGVQGADADAALPAGVANLGGMGRARSPTPYDALCFGVPFINPILTVRPRPPPAHALTTPFAQWDPAHPDDRSRWAAQHEALKHLGPPHVYNVFKNDADGLGAARIRYILHWMELTAVQARVGAALETDWRSAAEAVLAARVQAAAEKGGASGEEMEDEAARRDERARTLHAKIKQTL